MAVKEPEHPNPARWWRHRRRGYYSAMVWTVAQTLMWVWVAFEDAQILSALGAVIGWSYGIPATLIVAYYGNTAVEEWVKKGAGQ